MPLRCVHRLHESLDQKPRLLVVLDDETGPSAAPLKHRRPARSRRRSGTSCRGRSSEQAHGQRSTGPGLDALLQTRSLQAGQHGRARPRGHVVALWKSKFSTSRADGSSSPLAPKARAPSRSSIIDALHARGARGPGRGSTCAAIARAGRRSAARNDAACSRARRWSSSATSKARAERSPTLINLACARGRSGPGIMPDVHEARARSTETMQAAPQRPRREVGRAGSTPLSWTWCLICTARPAGAGRRCGRQPRAALRWPDQALRHDNHSR